MNDQPDLNERYHDLSAYPMFEAHAGYFRLLAGHWLVAATMLLTMVSSAGWLLFVPYVVWFLLRQREWKKREMAAGRTQIRSKLTGWTSLLPDGMEAAAVSPREMAPAVAKDAQQSSPTVEVNSTAGTSSDMLPWLIAVAPFLVAIGSEMIGLDVPAMMIHGVAIGLVCWDMYRLKAVSRSAPSPWWALILPVYLWRRATLTDGKRAPFWASIACMVIGLIVILSGGPSMEEHARDLVNQIIQEQFELVGNAPSCLQVRLTAEEFDGFYRGTALLEGNIRIPVTVQNTAEGIFVEIPYEGMLAIGVAVHSR